MIHQLRRKQVIPASLEEVWDFFSDPRNLNQITPPDLEFEILFGGEVKMYPGQLMAYKIRLLPLVKTRWLTEISQVREPFYFLDKQLQGPYRLWNHEHQFQAVSGGVEMIDQVTYQLPFGPLGELVHRIWVGPRLKRIFDYRTQIISKIFGDSTNKKSRGL